MGSDSSILIFIRFSMLFGRPVKDSEIQSGLNSGVGFKNIDFSLVFQCFWAIGFTLEDYDVNEFWGRSQKC